MKLKFLKAAIVSTVLAFSSFSNAGLITTNADPELALSTIIDFSALTSGSSNQVVFNGGQFDTPGLFGFAVWNNYGSTGGAFYNTGPSTQFSLTFDSVVSAFGINVGVINSSWTWEAYDINNILIESISFPDQNSGSAFYGIAASNIKSVLFKPVNDQVAFDNLHFVSSSTNVPEPSTLAIFALGIIGLASRRFKK